MDAEHSESGPPAGAARPPRRIWCETVPYAVLGSTRVLALLRRFALRPLVAVRPWNLPELPAFAERARGEGVLLGLWPMLSDADGRWLSETTAGPFGELCGRVLDAVGSSPPAELALDLEPPIQLTRALLTLERRRRSQTSRRRGLAALGERGGGGKEGQVRTLVEALAGRLSTQGGILSAAIVPLVLLDAPPRAAPAESAESAESTGSGGRDRGPGWQALLGTPLDGLPFDHASAMLYTTLAGYARPFLGRREALELLAHFAALASARLGARAGISLGAVGRGALGDEPIYNRPAELAEDVAIAEASGISSLSLLDLGGVLARPPAEAWLEAFAGQAGKSLDASSGVGRFGFGPGVRRTLGSRRGWRTEVVLGALRTLGPVTRWLGR